ncbi:hypothetical protein GSI_02678 [Ganoderma sinense ZZ0214-1]|uniref:DUF6534 domain-containing protein n=1 Tax=Ganoderma sinense ZZ0214-1 TaxID=1077348 RepID=A0A2G8SMA7_9APHY|nr:hypothetical protein GSI_02678 [Ganoderma sinense ZZ0214-1]
MVPKVAFIFILDTLSLVLAVDAFYKFIVTDLFDPLLLLNVPRASAFENGVSVLLRTLTQWYVPPFGALYALSNRQQASLLIEFGALACAFSSFSLGIVVSLHMYTDSYIFSLATVNMRIIAGIDNGTSVICDIVIMVSLCYYLHSRRTGFRRTDSIINRLIVYAVNRGALTTICQGGEMVTMVVLPGRFMFVPFALVGGKLYCNTLFAT